MRIDQLISQSTSLSRNDVKKAIRNKQVTINSRLCKNTNTKITEEDVVLLGKQKIDWPRHHYFMLNKPTDYCCSHTDDGHPSSLTLLPETHKKLHFAGRLDADTTGLVLVSSDGQWCHRVTSPKQAIDKCKTKHYRVILNQPLTDATTQQLQQGVLLHGESKLTAPALVKLIEPTLCNIVISEGKYHQVKRMFVAVGNHVESLHRFQIATIALDEKLAAGEYRPLTQQEIKEFS